MKKKNYKIELSESAANDFERSYKYYDNESPKLAEGFIKEVDKSFVKIGKNPTAYPVVHNHVRKSVLKRFPFVVYFRIKEVIIQVIAIFHTSRNPEIWKDRAEE